MELLKIHKILYFWGTILQIDVREITDNKTTL